MGTVHRRRAERTWEGVAPQAYDDPGLAGVEKLELIGPADGAPHYRVRYFHVPAGGRTARETAPPGPGVVIETGRARVTLDDDVHEVGPGDVVYVAGGELHCFEALGDAALGFICVAPPAT